MTEKQPLFQGGEPSAPPAYQQHPASQPPPGYAPAAPYKPPTQAVGGQGYQQASNTTVFIQPAQQQTRVVVGLKPPNYVILSVITTVVFCWVFGLIGLYLGSQVDSAWLRGDRDEAHRCSRQARLWNIVGMVAGVVTYVVAVVLSVGVNVALTASG